MPCLLTFIVALVPQGMSNALWYYCGHPIMTCVVKICKNPLLKFESCQTWVVVVAKMYNVINLRTPKNMRTVHAYSCFLGLGFGRFYPHPLSISWWNINKQTRSTQNRVHILRVIEYDNTSHTVAWFLIIPHCGLDQIGQIATDG